MGTQIAEVQRTLAPIMQSIESTLEQLLPPALPPERLLQTLYVSCAANPNLMTCDRTSLLQAATSAAVLGLEIDGVSGQGYLVPFKGRAQFVGGYKGYVTLASRGGRSLEGFVVREGDRFEFDEANGIVDHRRVLGDEESRKLIAAYAVSRGPVQQVRVLSLDQLLARRDQSAGWKGRGARSTWGTHFTAMCRKTPMRDLANDLPVLSLQAAAALETQHDLGRHAWLRPEGGVVVDGDREVVPVSTGQPSADQMTAAGLEVVYPSGGRRQCKSISDYEEQVVRDLRRAPPEMLAPYAELNRPRAAALVDRYPEVAGRLVDLLASVE
jgi:recombination protein RecT